MTKSLKFSFLLFLGLFLGVSPVRAIDLPDFPSCTSPTGSILVNYESGIHGIPGSSGEYVGSDVVYTVSDTQVTQCFCAVSGSGIQTNWWKLNSLDQEQIEYLKNLGWIYIADGSAWGLDATPYMALNTQYNCGGAPVVTPTPTGSPAPQPCNGCGGAPTWSCTAAKPAAPVVTSVVRSATTAQITWTAVANATHYVISYGTEPGKYIYGVPNTGKVTSYVVGSLVPGTRYYFVVIAVNDCMPSDPSTSGQVLGASTTRGDVLGLASTGSLPAVYLSLALGGLFFALFLLTKKLSRRSA
ncbi:hypothetical protein A2397_02475 [Candidatus Amesbacteria bacterium RIFOXYB1_FULL_44_23]|uniref:Fibronectin type-III domain-containing protein n=1 Tax=Candidatus Amesbacteria bacterium RIFOXYB1_FULL_44_23 TaxID=1797263 RepID=A0A1F4ZVI2_9BACT|nr:MAG: hypothetical protein A2397_02475 [Candidatus Amesbacteria bacterium RIFOXYB1_FULL_44_23]